MDIVEPDALDDDELAILAFIESNPGTTANRVVREMNKGQCSPMTTHRKLKSLVRRGFIDDRKSKQNSFHSLIKNDKNKFNVINTALDRIYSLMKETDITAAKLFDSLDKEDYHTHAKTLSHLAAMYRNTFSNMLETLLIEVHKNVTSTKDSQFLYTKIILLMLEIAEFNNIVTAVLNPLTMDVQMLKAALEVALKDNSFRSYIKKTGINLTVFNSYLTKINNYYMKFNEEFPNKRWFLAGLPTKVLDVDSSTKQNQ